MYQLYLYITETIYKRLINYTKKNFILIIPKRFDFNYKRNKAADT